MHVHLIGIGGTGLSAIATILLQRGVTVSGSDRQASLQTLRLEEMGARVAIGHRSENIAGADLIVRSSAISAENPEVQAAVAAGIPVLRREDFLEQLIGSQRTIAIAGAHGKTTTTSMITWMLVDLGLDPSYVVGGVVANLGTNAQAGKGAHFVIEADEYDRMFLGLRPWIAVVTNIEHDHPDCYPTGEDFFRAFEQFAEQILPGGTLVACADDPGATRLLARVQRAGGQVIRYGIDAPDCDVRALRPTPNAQGGYSFRVVRGESLWLSEVPLQIPGLHNVRNALAALIVASLLGLPDEEIVASLSKFHGAGRRFDVRGEPGGVLLIDDYAHHPTEIRATLEAARSRYPSRRLWAVWQPHTYSRLRALFDDFNAAFDGADCVLVTDVYAAREHAPEDGFSSQHFVDALVSRRARAGGCVHGPVNLSYAREWLAGALQPGDVVMVLSAGDADQITNGLLNDLKGEGSNG